MRIFEIFSSFQGEGKHQGMHCTFLRLSGCNLACRWCDTTGARDPEAGEELPPDLVIERLRGAGYLCITGGEPLLQMEELLPVLEALSQTGCVIEIETNGTIPFDPVLPYASVCMDVKCPSSGEKSDLQLLSSIRPNDSVRFVVADEEDLAYVKGLLASSPIRGDIFISPVYGSDYQAIAAELLRWDHIFRLQLQLHKQIGVR